ncbi:MAG: winged helix-turn-helix transcriptional regulator, partial [Gammaproteobacteria bacterium]
MLAHKWTGPIIYHLYQAGGAVRFRQLQRLMKPVTQKSLTQRLRELEKAELVSRTVYEEVPPRVEYRLTELGLALAALHPPASHENHPGDNNANDETPDCSMVETLKVLLRKWAGPTVYHLYQSSKASKAGGAVRFRQLQRLMKPVTQKELTQRLRELE